MSPENMADRYTPIQYQRSFVAFLDILGFKEKVLESQDKTKTLKLLVDSLDICGAFSSGEKETTHDGSVPMQSRFFSDTIVVFTKKQKRNLVQLFFLVRYLQDRLWERGICLRGAITLGDMYWPEKETEITVGPALIKAYELEQKIAIYPRIIVSEELYTYINNIKAYPFGGGLRAEKPDALLKDYIKRDADGVYFLDLLNEGIIRVKKEDLVKPSKNSFSVYYIKANGSNHSEILEKVKLTINDNIYSKDDKIRQKYEWLKTYVSKVEPKT